MNLLLAIIVSVGCSLPNTCSNAGLIAITFDDGPTNYTLDILDIAEENNIKLTFHFTVHQRMTGNLTNIYKRVVEEGHTLGLRVNPGRDYDQMESDMVKNDIDKQIESMNKASGTKIKYARAPQDGSSYNEDVYNALLSKGVIQTSSTFSPYIFDDPVEEFRSMIEGSSYQLDSFIVQMHDAMEEKDNYLQDFIDIGKQHGYTFVNLEECLGDYEPEPSSGGRSGSKLSSDGVADICLLPLFALIFHIL